jgi:hypothetical protein
MAEIWIQEEKINEEFLDIIGHYISIDGDIKSIYFISETSEEENDDKQLDFLNDFLVTQNKYPLYLTFVCDDEQEEDFKEELSKLECDYNLQLLEEEQTYYVFLKRVKYHPRCFTVKIPNSHILTYVLEKTFWLSEMNNFYAISYTDNLRFQLQKVKEWGRKKERSIPFFKTEENTTFITIFHDGAGFYLFSNLDKYSTLNSLESSLPIGTIITQINDELVNEDTK